MRLLILLFLSIFGPFNALGQSASSDQPVKRRHGYTVLGEPGLPPDFRAFPYVHVFAPKGGDVTLASIGTFDGFNPFILRGTAAAHGVSSWVTLPGGSGSGSSVGHVWETLMTGSADEVATAYGHLAETIEVPDNRLSVTFNLRSEAKFSDGRPVTAEDVAWTFRTLLEKGRPSFRIQFGDIKDVTVESVSRVRFNFSTDRNRDLPLVMGGLPVLPKHYFEGRDFAKPLSDAPIGSGPYRVTNFELGRSVTYTRNPNWWAADMPTGRGTNNFDRVRYDYYRDALVAMEAFKAGKADIRAENIAKNWASAYEFPAVKSGLVVKREYAHQLPSGIQGYALNTRRPVFADQRVRQAIGWMFDFEWTNKNLFYSAYTRTTSYFSNTDLAATGLPMIEESKLLLPYSTTLPSGLLSRDFAVPVTDGSGNNRDQVRQALELMREAGWSVKERKLVDKVGQQMSITILLDEPSYERVALPYVQNLKKLGIDVHVRTVDPAQYQHLIDEFDFDMAMMIYPGADVPGNELRDYWSCAAANTKGSANIAGICDPAIDMLIDRIISAPDRDTVRASARALDRILLWSWYMVPNWHSQNFHVAYWDRFGELGKPIREGVNFDTWWVDEKKAARVDETRK